MKFSYLVFRDHYILEKVFDSYLEANKYLKACRERYMGYFEIKSVKDKNFKKGLSHYDRAITI